MRQVLNYNIHDILRFQIRSDMIPGFKSLHNLRFSCFETQQVERPDIVLNTGGFTPENKNCYLVDHKYHIRDNYFYCRDSEGKVGWEVEITGLEQGDTVINLCLSKRFQKQPADLLRIPLFFPQALLLRVIEHRLSTKGYLLTHSAAVSKDDQAYLLSGRAGSFKTSLCMDFVRRGGFTCLGDDRVILSQDRVFGFPVNYAIFDFMVKRLPDETRFGLPKQVQFAAGYLRGKYGKDPGNGAQSGKPKALLLVTRSRGLPADKRVNFESLPRSALEEIVASILTSNRLEDFSGMGMPGFGISSAPFLRYMLAYSFVFPDSLVATWERDMATILRNTLENIPVYRVEIPPEYDPDIFNQIHRFIERNC